MFNMGRLDLTSLEIKWLFFNKTARRSTGTPPYFAFWYVIQSVSLSCKGAWARGKGGGLVGGSMLAFFLKNPDFAP